MISIPLKFTHKTDMVPALTKFMAVRYKDEAPKYHDALAEFQAMRNTVATIGVASEAAREVLLKYYAQVSLVRDRLPVSDAGNGAKVAFTWTDSLKPRKQFAQANWVFEQACVLFNLAAVESQLASSTKRDTPGGIEAAGKRFCGAAGILAHIRDVTLKSAAGGVVLGALPTDLSHEGLNMLVQLQLAQGQACYYEMARVKGMKPDTCAKLAGKAGDLYREATRCLPESVWAEMDADFPWSVYCRLYTACFDAASFWQMALKAGADAAEKGDGYGAEVAWLRVAENACRRALEGVQSSRIKPEVKATIDTSSAAGLLEQVVKRRQEAEEENAKIYMNLVPEARELPVVGRADLAKPAPFPDMAPYTRCDLFASLVPTEMSGAVVELDSGLEDLVGVWKARADAASDAAAAALAAGGVAERLDASASSEAGLPDRTWERVARVVAAGGVRELDSLSATLASAAEGARRVLDDAEAALDDEAATDATYRAQYGDHWTAAPSSLVAAEQRGELAKLRKVADVAAGSDGAVASRLTACRSRLAALTQPRPQLEASIPSLSPSSSSAAAPAGEGLDTLRASLKAAVAEVTALTAARPGLVANLRRGFDRSAAIRTLAAAGGAAQPPAQGGGGGDDSQSARVAAALARDSGLSSAVGALEHSLGAQGPALERVALASERYARARAGDERLAAREAALSALAADLSVFEELLSHLREGGEFYRNLRAHADTLLTNARDLASARGLQQRELLLALRGAQALAGGAVPTATALSPGHVEEQMALAARMGVMHLGAPPVAQPAGGSMLPLPPPAPLQRGSSLVSASVQPHAYNPFETAFEEPYPPRAAPTSPYGGAAGGGFYAQQPPPAAGAYPTALPPPQAPYAQQQQQPAYGAPYASGQQPAPTYASAPPSAGGAYPAGQAGYGLQRAPGVPPAQQQQVAPPQYLHSQPAGPQQAMQAAPVQRAMPGGPVPQPQQQQPGGAIPDTPQLRSLLSMGFERGAAHRALVAHGGNVEAAVNGLVIGSVV